MKIAASSLWLETKYGYEKAFRMMKEAGFDGVDYGIDDWVGTEEQVKASRCYYMSDEELREHFTRIYECARDIGLEIVQTHAIFGAGTTIKYPELFKKVTERTIYATSLLHCKHVVVHPVATEGRIFDEEYDVCHAYNLEFFRSFRPALEKYGVKLAVEPMWSVDKNEKICGTICSRPEEILQFIDELGSDCYCSCPDIGHFVLTASSTGVSPADAIRKLGKTIEITHVHEVDGTRDNHTAPYRFRGAMDWEEILAAFADAGYDGALNFEVGGNYYEAYPESLLPEALKHFATIARSMADKIEEMKK